MPCPPSFPWLYEIGNWAEGQPVCASLHWCLILRDVWECSLNSLSKVESGTWWDWLLCGAALDSLMLFPSQRAPAGRSCCLCSADTGCAGQSSGWRGRCRCWEPLTCWGWGQHSCVHPAKTRTGENNSHWGRRIWCQIPAENEAFFLHSALFLESVVQRLQKWKRWFQLSVLRQWECRARLENTCWFCL